jgi:anti-sigma regulatory factor (Ser/Thr protein kinase)
MVPLPTVSVLDRDSVSVVREQVRAAGREAGLETVATEELALVASELAQNQLDHARAGRMAVSLVARGGVPGVQVTASDEGPGILDPDQAFAGAAVPRGLGAGLPTVRRHAQELDVDVRYGEGTVLSVRRFAGVVPAHPEVAVLGQGVEPRSGDHAWLRREPDGLLLVVIDGVGHGEPAREAARLAAGAMAGCPSRDPATLLRATEPALRGSRGVAASVAWWDVGARTVSVAGVGNVAVHLYDPADGVRGLLCTPGILGTRSPRQISVRSFPVSQSAVLVMHTDGLSSSGDHAQPRSLWVRPPLLVATHLLAHERKLHDDALVLVAR